jgi:urea transport system substrate-binding protein
MVAAVPAVTNLPGFPATAARPAGKGGQRLQVAAGPSPVAPPPRAAPDTPIMQPSTPPEIGRAEPGRLTGRNATMPAFSKRWWRHGLPLLAALAGGAALAWLLADRLLVDRRPVVVGILHSPSGPLAASERSMIDAMLMAIDEINRTGGLLGRRVRGVIAATGPEGGLARQTERLIRDERASVIIGCGTSGDRKVILPVIEHADHLLLQIRPYEGLEHSASVVSTGAVANQQITPAVQWCHDNLSARRFLLVGPDDVWPRCINAIAADQIRGVGDEVLDEMYLPPASTSVEDAVRRVVELEPDVVLCSLAGDAATAFFSRLRAAGVRPDRTPVVAFELSEDDLRKLDVDDAVGNYVAANYFQSIDRPENLAFVRAFKARYGEDRSTTAAVVNAYDSVRMWAQAVQEAETVDVRQVREALRSQSLDAPAGIIAIDPDTQHAWQPVFIGRVRGDRQFDIVWSSRTAVRPVPFPISRSRSAWEHFLQGLHHDRGGPQPAASAAIRRSAVGEPPPR